MIIYYILTSSLINALSSTLAGLLVITRNPRSNLNRSFFYFATSVAFWSYCYYLWQVSDNKIEALFWCRNLMIGAIFIPPTFLHFSIAIIGKFNKYSKQLFFWYMISFVFLFLNFTPLLVKDVSPRLFFPYWPSAGVMFTPFLIQFLGLPIFAHVLMYRSYKRLSGLKRNQIKYIVLGTAIGFIGGSTNYPLWYGVPIPPIGNILVSVYVVLLAYSIARYRLMDINIAITRAGVFILTYSIILGIPFIIAFTCKDYLISRFAEYWGIIPLISSTLLAIVGPFMYIYIQKKAEDKILSEQKHYQTTLRHASLGMGQIKDLKRLLNLIVHIVTRAVQIENCKIFLLHEESKNFVLKASKNSNSVKNGVSTISADSKLIEYFKKTKEPLVYDEIKQIVNNTNDAVLRSIEKNLSDLKAALVIPSFIENQLIAVFVLGEKKSGQVYSQDDLAVFAILANQSALAIENAMYYDDMKRTQEQLFKAEKMATIGTMADGLSHQINNRLHAMGFIAGDVLDTIQLKKKGNILPETREVLDEIEEGLARIQDNVTRGGEIVGGLLKYTRKGEQGFSAVSLKDLIKSAMEMAQFKVKVSDFKLIENFDAETTPLVRGNFTQLQEVFFNLIDNAYDAMMQRKEDYKEEGYQPTLRFSVQSKDKNLEILLEDNGIGVRKSDMHKMFTPFFTTKVSSKKGTGLGMYVIRQIIEENHGGQVLFTSEYKEGSQTKIVLPIAKEEIKNEGIEG